MMIMFYEWRQKKSGKEWKPTQLMFMYYATTVFFAKNDYPMGLRHLCLLRKKLELATVSRANLANLSRR